MLLKQEIEGNGDTAQKCCIREWLSCTACHNDKKQQSILAASKAQGKYELLLLIKKECFPYVIILEEASKGL